MHMRSRVLGLLILCAFAVGGCTRAESPAGTPAAVSADADFQKLSDEFVADYMKRNPTAATYLGVHDYDDQLEDASRAAVDREVADYKQFRARFAAIDPSRLSLANQLDLAQVVAAIDSHLLEDEVIRSWAKNPDVYSSSITGTAYIMIKRSFAPPEVRLKALAARERLMLKTLEEGRKNLDNPPSIYTDIAIQQMDGNIGFFARVVPSAFTDVKDPALLADFKASNQAVVDALTGYKTFLQNDLKPRSKGTYAIGADTLEKKYRTDEMVDASLDRLLAIAEADLARNTDAFNKTASEIAPGKPAKQALALVSSDHPAPSKLLEVSQASLDNLRQFITAHHLVTIPGSTPAKVVESPPFMRALSTASMDTPGPFETKATEAYYNVTLPDPAWPKARVDSYMRAWYFPQIINVSIHEVYPGHYTQFLYGPQFPSKIRKIFGAGSNSEGWAHYCEQMMLDEGFAPGDAKARLAQLQDALLRDVRFIAGIKLNTNQITVEQAQTLFEEKGFQEPPVALAEARRGTSNPTYGYYTLGKLMILKLRDDYRAKQGAAFTLQDFHDRFLKLGPLPLPLIRRAMLGEAGDPLPPTK